MCLRSAVCQSLTRSVRQVGIIMAVTDLEPTLYCSDCLMTFHTDGPVCPNLSCGSDKPDAGWGQMYQPGSMIDRTYRVSRRLALGGAGVTYLVRMMDESGEEAGPWIALKLLFASRDHGAYLRRLATEAQILQELHHPHIVEYLGFVHRTGQSPYLLTKFEEGGSLLDHMKRVGTMGVRETAEVGRQVCRALAKGHSKGITHRDLKPENLLITELTAKGDPPTVRVADFGIAKVTGSIGTGITRAGVFVGTPQYAAPEQFLGQPTSPTADVYSLGAVMIFMMTARPLVPNAHRMDSEDVYTALLDALPPSILRPSDAAKDCEAMNRVLDAAMALEPDERCSVQAMERMLTELIEGAGTEEEHEPGDDAPAPIEFEPPESLGAALPTQSDALTQMNVNAVPQRAPRSTLKWAVAIIIAVGALAFGGVWWSMPWLVDGVPIVSPAASSSVSGAKGAIDRAVRMARGELREACPGAKGSSATMDVVINADGSIRWARVVKASSNKVAAQCFARGMRWRSSGQTLAMPGKARLRLKL